MNTIDRKQAIGLVKHAFKEGSSDTFRILGLQGTSPQGIEDKDAEQILDDFLEVGRCNCSIGNMYCKCDFR